MECAEEARRAGALPGFTARSTRGIALLGKSAADLLARIAHVIGLLVSGGVVAVFAEADSLEELGKFPRLGIGQNNWRRGWIKNSPSTTRPSPPSSRPSASSWANRQHTKHRPNGFTASDVTQLSPPTLRRLHANAPPNTWASGPVIPHQDPPEGFPPLGRYSLIPRG